MRLNLKVPFAEKDEAKKLGARWDPGRKIWYVEGKEDLTPFERWSPTPHAAAEKHETSAVVQVGAQYVEIPRVCDCLPWEVCDKCRASALSS